MLAPEEEKEQVVLDMMGSDRRWWHSQELVEACTARGGFMGTRTLTGGGIYGVMYRLSRAGFVKSRREPDPEAGGLPRVQWHITEGGIRRRIELQAAGPALPDGQLKPARREEHCGL